MYGAAGMGKSNLCRQIAHLWAEGDQQIGQRFQYVIPIPMRLARSHSLLDIICKDVKLIPDSCKDRLQQELELNSANVLFVLDSYEELSHTEYFEELNKLIRGDIYEDSSVILTSRPNKQIDKIASSIKPRITAHLQVLTEKQVTYYIRQFPCLHKDARSVIEKKFGLGFLQRPINLWLLCYLLADITTGSKAGLPDTQTALLNLILQHVLQGYVKKKKLPEFKLTSESPIDVEDAPYEVKLMLQEAGKLCYLALRERSHSIKIDGSVLSKAALLAMGLFAEGSEEDALVLPHPVFQEYLAALYLSTDSSARDALFVEIESKFKVRSSGHVLVDVLRSLYLENTVTFLVGLMPAAAVKQLSGLFMIHQEHTIIHNVRDVACKEQWPCFQPDLQYELDLLQECNDDNARSVIAKALLNAPTTWTAEASHTIPIGHLKNRGAHHLLSHFTAEETHMFLRKAYNCKLQEKDCQRFLLRDSNHFPILDSYAVACAFFGKFAMEMDSLQIVHSHILVHFIAQNVAEVPVLTLADCTLCEKVSDYICSLHLKDKPLATPEVSQPDTLKNTSIKELELQRVRGLNHLCTMQATNKLILHECGDVSFDQLKRIFPVVTDITLKAHKLLHSAQTNLSVEKLILDECEQVDIVQLSEILTQLKVLEAESSEITIKETPHQWKSMKQMSLTVCQLGTGFEDLSDQQARDILSRLCPQAEIHVEGYVSI